MRLPVPHDAGPTPTVAIPVAQDSQPPGPAKGVLRLFAAARLAAGTGRAEVVGSTVGDVLVWARTEYGPAFSAVLDRSRVWRNGEPADLETPLSDGDEVAVLPPVSGGAVTVLPPV
jgi:sulfur-carrier protein